MKKSKTSTTDIIAIFTILFMIFMTWQFLRFILESPIENILMILIINISGIGILKLFFLNISESRFSTIFHTLLFVYMILGYLSLFWEKYSIENLMILLIYTLFCGSIIYIARNKYKKIMDSFKKTCLDEEIL